MTPTDDAARHREYLRALRDLGVSDADALAMTLAYIQAESLRLVAEAPERPAPKRVR